MKKEKKKNREAEIPKDVSTLRGWRKARHSAPASRPPTVRVTINLDADIVAIFKADALKGGAPYQVAINQALRSYLRDREMSQRERAAELVLEALRDSAVIERVRQIH
jgi:uncharacterized protein (DUF4415 family)